MSTEGNSADIHQTLACLVTNRLHTYADDALLANREEAIHILQDVLALMHAHHQQERAALIQRVNNLDALPPARRKLLQKKIRLSWQRREYVLAALAHSVSRHLDGSSYPLAEGLWSGASPFVP